MPADYQLILYDPFGVELGVLDSFSTLDLVRKVNGVGSLVLNLPKTFDDLLFTGDDIRPDNRIAVFRKVGGGGFYLEGDTQWMVVDGYKNLSESGERISIVKCEDAIGLLKRRTVAYNAGSAQALKTATFADNAMKAIVDENFSTSATDTDRRLATTLLTIQANQSLGASVGKAFARRNVLDVLIEYANASELAGTYLAFDIASQTQSTLEFRTYASQRGVDRRWPGGSNPVLLSQELGNLSGASIGYLHSQEINYVYAGGQGIESARNVQVSSDTTRIALSPFNRRESFVDARMTNTSSILIDEADAAVRAGNIKRPFSARFTENETTLYGLHVNFGDFVTAVYEGQKIDCRLNNIRLNVRGGQEQIDARLQGEA